MQLQVVELVVECNMQSVKLTHVLMDCTYQNGLMGSWPGWQ